MSAGIYVVEQQMIHVLVFMATATRRFFLQVKPMQVCLRHPVPSQHSCYFWGELFWILVCPGLWESSVWLRQLFWLVFHSLCHFRLVSSSASWYMVLLVILAKAYFVPSLRAASFASLSAISLPYIPAWALTHKNIILHSLLSRLATFF